MDTDKLNWKSISFGDIGLNPDFEGLIGIEECSDYNVLSKNRRKRGGKKEKVKQLKRKLSNADVKNVVPPKKAKNNSFGDFQVEDVSPETLSPSSKINKVNNKKNKLEKEKKVKENNTKQKSKKKKQKDKSLKVKDNKKQIEVKKNSNEDEKDDETKQDDKEEEMDVPLDDMQAWSRFNLPDIILKGLALQKFTNPTEIQELTLPAAMFGRRDILGAAETGSGKTLAFGIPIINSILQLKERPFMGMNEKFRKPKKGKTQEDSKKTEQNKIINYNKLNSDEKTELLGQFKKSKKGKKKQRHDFDEEMEDEDSHCSDPESDDDEEELGDDSDEVDNESDEDELDLDDDGLDENDSEDEGMDSDEEIDDASDDASDIDDNDSDIDDDNSDIDNGVFMSVSKVKKLIESRKLAKLQKSAQNVKKKKIEKTNPAKNDDVKKKADEIEDKSVPESDESDFEEKEEAVEGVNEKGVGCVKVIDNIESSDLPNWNENRRSLKPLYALVLTPTRELAIQVKNHLVAAAKFTGISVAVVVGGMSQEKQERLLSRGPEIVVATPGRLWQLIQIRNAHLSQISDIKFFAIDETDRMLEHGHFEELHQLLERLNEDEDKRGGRQNFVFSATLTMVHDLPTYLKKKKVTKKGKLINRKIKQLTADQKLKKVIEMLGITDPKIIDVTKQNQGTSTTLMECRIVCSIEQKDYYLYYVLKRHPGRTIIFCNSIGCVKRLSQLFGLLQCNPLPLHANMQQRQRLKNLDRFKANPHGVLVATDVAARGLDIPDVEHVIHYQVPRTAENYVHRSGRTARASKEGITILIMEAGEVQNYNKMCKTLNKKEDLPHFPIDNPLLSAVMQRVDMARELDLLMLKVRKDNSQKGWLEKAAKEMDMVLDERNMPKGINDDFQSDMKYVLNSKRKQLTSLLASPLFPKGFSFKYPTFNAHLEEALGLKEGQNAIQVMKTALENGGAKKGKNTTMNQALLKLQQKTAPVTKTSNQAVMKSNDGEKLSKNKWKKMKRTRET